jgi:hypothetical protein
MLHETSNPVAKAAPAKSVQVKEAAMQTWYSTEDEGTRGD